MNTPSFYFKLAEWQSLPDGKIYVLMLKTKDFIWNEGWEFSISLTPCKKFFRYLYRRELTLKMPWVECSFWAK